MNVVSFMDPETGAPLSGKNNVFQYDEIFDTSSDTHAIYERVGRRIVRSTLGGINGTIFSYGQTSSGKTFTMQGDGKMSQPGLLQLAVEDIFQFIETCADRDFFLRVSFLEIYNEVLREDPRKGVYVECHEKIITDYEDIVTLLQTGNQNRTVGQTAMNEKSSRSHSVFPIVIESKEKSESRRLSKEDMDGAVLVASLNLVDLAGSESLRHTGSEAGNINKSLLTLARVINSLSTPAGGGQKAPFRDSKLTRLLQNSLGGNTRTLIICCVTPSDRFVEETKSKLQFAARAKDIKTVATVNEVLYDQTQLRRIKREVHELRKLTKSETLSALKDENEALIIEKNHNRSEITRLMGLILSSSSVAKANTTNRERKRRGKRMRETRFPRYAARLAMSSITSFPSKKNRDPEPLLRILEDVDETPAKIDSLVINLSPSQHKPKRTGLDDSSKKLLDLFSAVLQSYHDKNFEDPIAAAETIVEEKSACLDDIERTHALDVLASIKTLMMTNIQSKRVMDEKLMLDLEVKELRSKLDSARFDSRSQKLFQELTNSLKNLKASWTLPWSLWTMQEIVVAIWK
ncbi:hypothetical protein PsorP6_007436 [Peronosclerospora sorghi]|uniref:Uncharacterized protein n=1 Tax=Peronosclerospora sorghi TaxID=230839 RepID=A0ACC0W9L3_9STRA|nr:hypothetical protein PsorP6_007436 [Peronosclerospora sorghi]